MNKTKTKIASLVASTFFLSINSTFAVAEDVQLELSFPKTTYGLGAWGVETGSIADCEITIDNTKITNAKSGATLSMEVGTHDFSAKCFGSGGETLRQQYFGSLVKSQDVISGTQNSVTLQMLTANPRTVLTKIDSPEVSPGLQYVVKLLNGETQNVTLDTNSSVSLVVHNDNPPIEIYSTSGVKIGDLTYEKYSFPLFLTKTVGISVSTQPTSVEVRLGDGSNFIYDPDVGLVINDLLDENSKVNITVPNVPNGRYEVRLSDQNGNILAIQGIVTDSSLNTPQTLPTGNNILNLSGNTTIQIDLSNVILENITPKIYLLPVNSDI